MNHVGTQIIETERLILRRFSTEDAQSMFDNWASDEEVTKFMTWPPYHKVEDVAGYLEYVVKSYDDNAYYWAIVLKELGEPVGAISAVSINEAANLVHVGYCMGQNWWHKGIMSEAFAAVIKFFFEEVGVNRVEARHDPRNPNSGGVMKKCGLKYEGTLRQADVNNQGICDAAWYAILREDYKG